MKRKYLPLGLKVAGRNCLVIGSDREAVEKTERLIQSGARTAVIAPDLSPENRKHLISLGARILSRDFKLSDLTNQFLVMFSIQGNSRLTKKVFEACRKKRILLCAIDQVDYCDVVNMSLYERGPLKIAISTDAVSPALARKIRQGLDSSLKDVPLEEFMEHLSQIRKRTTKDVVDPTQRRATLIDAVKDFSFKCRVQLPSWRN